jgi:rhodanese-related sulfurtransferase
MARNQTNAAVAADSLSRRLEEKGLQHIDTAEILELFRDPRYEQGLVMFIDARDDDHYAAGHIPGAYQFFHYRPEKYAGSVLPLAQAAQQVVIYCNGGDCEDSEFAAMMLRDMGVPVANLYVYLGGYSDWSTNNLPIEVGERLSGDIRNEQKAHANQ